MAFLSRLRTANSPCYCNIV